MLWHSLLISEIFIKWEPNNFLIIIKNSTELLKVERADEYQKDLWQLNIEERLQLIPKLKEKGNNLYGQKAFDEAEKKYHEAISILEQLMIR